MRPYYEKKDYYEESFQSTASASPWRSRDHIDDPTYKVFGDWVDQFFGLPASCSPEACCTAHDSEAAPWDPNGSALDTDGDVDYECELENLDNSLDAYSGLKGMVQKLGKQASVQEEVNFLVQSTGDLFHKRGWSIEHTAGYGAYGDNFTVNGRDVRLLLMPHGFPLPKYDHHAKNSKLGPAVAQKAAHIMVHDGPLRQPLLDYLMQTGLNEHYDSKGIGNPQGVMEEVRKLSLQPSTQISDRLDAMQHAKDEADLRQRIADTAQKELESANSLLVSSQPLTGSYSAPRDARTGRMPNSREGSLNRQAEAVDRNIRMHSRERNRMPDPFGLGGTLAAGQVR